MSREEIPQDFALRAQVAMIAGNEPESSFIEVRPLEPWGPQEFFPVRDVPAIEEAVRRLSADHEVFLGCAPRVRESGTKADVERVWCLWADCDSPESVARLRAFRPMPNMVVQSGTVGRLHAWWQISPSVSGEVAERGLRRLIGALGSDPACKDRSRVMRAITSIHRKHDEQVVRCAYLDVTAHSFEEIVGTLADPSPEPVETVRHQAPRVADALDAIPATEYVPILIGRELGRDNKISCPFHEDWRPSFHCYEDAESGWYCFQCTRGGGIVDFGALLYGIEPRGAGFHEIRRRLAADLLGRAAA
jgi:hypothetical protein